MPYPARLPLRQYFLPGALLMLSGMSLAQTSTDATKPTQPSQLQYVSPLRAYRAYADQSVASWREANDQVGRIGGWRAYAKEMQTGEPAKDVPAEQAKPAASTADPHAGHHGGAKR